MKIAILGIKGVPGRHGVEVVVDSLVPHLVELGHDITVYGYESYTNRSNNYHGAQIKTVSGSRHKNLEMITHMWRASVDSRKENFDIVHIHNTDPCLLSWVPKPKYGMIATSHGQAYLREKWSFAAKCMSRIAERFFIYLPDVITSVSKPLADYYQVKYNRKVEYIPNGIKFREKPDSAILSKWGIKQQQFLFCSAGRIERTKGIHTLIEAYSILKPDIPLVIAGGGEGTDPVYFEKLKREKPEGVKFVGFLTGDELYALYAHARIFLFPSEYEAMSMALLEGLSFGVPTIYSRIPENEAVANGIAYPFAVSNTVDLADQINIVSKNYAEALTIGNKAVDAIKRQHDWVTVAKQYSSCYHSISTKAG